ncbi:hypothetical protein CL634_05985 [bacterium]|nr:hypothetical protein [bacterium]
MSTQEESNNNQLTTVKTVYARIAVLLLAVNFVLTGYIVYSMNNTLQEQIDTVSSVSPALQEERKLNTN